MNDVIALLVESFERLDTAARDFEQGVGSYERLQARRDAVFAQIDAAKAVLAERDAEIARLRAELAELRTNDAIPTRFVRAGTIYNTRGSDHDITDDDCYGPDGRYNGIEAFSQLLARFCGRRVVITLDVFEDSPPTCHVCGTPTVLRQGLDRLRVYGCDACDTEYCRRKG